MRKLIVFLIVVFSLIATTVKADGGTIGVRGTPIFDEPLAQWPIAGLVVVQRNIQSDGYTWVLISSPRWGVRFAIQTEWDTSTNANATPIATSATPDATSATATALCTYSAAFLSQVGQNNPNVGLAVNAGTQILGPAIVQLNSMSVVAVYPGKTYTTVQPSIYWAYGSDQLSCLESQYVFFPGKNMTYSK